MEKKKPMVRRVMEGQQISDWMRGYDRDKQVQNQG